MREFFRRLFRKKLNIFCLFLFAVIVLMILFANFVAPYGPDDQDIMAKNLAPSLQHLAGTDHLGRDVFSRILYGGRVSLSIGIFASVVTTLAGAIIGSISAYFGGKVDNVIMRLCDVFMAMPPMLMAMAIVAALGQGVFNTLLAVILSGIPMRAYVARGPVLALRNQEFIEAATAVNTPTWKIILTHIIPNIMAPLIVQSTLAISGTITSVAGLSFLGLGIQPPNPEWGAMLSAGRNYLRDYPWQVLGPGIAMFLTLFSLNVLGDGVRDALDPKLKD